MEDIDNGDNLPDFGSPSVELKEEAEETRVETDETMEQAEKDEAEKEEPETPAANPEYVVVTGASTEATAEAATDANPSIIA